MSGCIWRATLVGLSALLVFLFAGLGALRAAPFRPLPAELFRPACAGGDTRLYCPLGVQPGAQTVTDGMAAVETTGWAARVLLYRSMEMRGGFVQWHWNGAQPAYFDKDKVGTFLYERGTIGYIELPTTLPFGAFWLALDGAIAHNLHGSLHPVANTRRAYQIIAYDGGLLSLRTDMRCPLRLAEFWYAPVVVRAYSPDEAAALLRAEPDSYTLPRFGQC